MRKEMRAAAQGILCVIHHLAVMDKGVQSTLVFVILAVNALIGQDLIQQAVIIPQRIKLCRNDKAGRDSDVYKRQARRRVGAERQ